MKYISTTILNYKVNGFDKYFANILLKYPRRSGHDRSCDRKILPRCCAAIFLKYSFVRYSVVRESGFTADSLFLKGRKNIWKVIYCAIMDARSVIYVANKVLRINIILNRLLDSRLSRIWLYNNDVIYHRKESSLFQRIFPSGSYLQILCPLNLLYWNIFEIYSTTGPQ